MSASAPPHHVSHQTLATARRRSRGAVIRNAIGADPHLRIRRRGTLDKFGDPKRIRRHGSCPISLPS